MAERKKLPVDRMKGSITGVSAWAEATEIPTYAAGAPDKNPMFLEKRVYQGSSGKVYPLPFIDSVATHSEAKTYAGLHVENAYVYLMVLPEIGGRIHIGFDKVADYDFFYRQNVIKPALVGLEGPWISGGVEFNWPQHHRPSTFMPCAWKICDEGGDGVVVWLSEHEPMNRMKGMHGVRLKKDSTLVELDVRLYNRTPHMQTFLWWANVAARVHEQYQSFFPPDVHFIGDHAKRAIQTFPEVKGRYYGVDYEARGLKGVPEDEVPSQFQNDGSYRADRLDWFSNIPVPTSYMVLETKFNFFGGYDHAADAGFVHVADRHIAPGKKQWTWGNQEFGYGWDRNLTDDGGPYVELMAGVYTDNQPDFSFLAPYETKTFRQYWYPIRKIGIPINATTEAALSIRREGSDVVVGICPTSRFEGARISLHLGGDLVEENATLEPTAPWIKRFPSAAQDVTVMVRAASGLEIVRGALPGARDDAMQPPEPATEPPEPELVTSNDDLWLTGMHLEQYRHATRSPLPYWEEAIRREPHDARCLLALGKWHLRMGEFAAAKELLVRAVKSVTRRNPNPYDGEPFYQLGLCCEFLGQFDSAFEGYAKAAWNAAWKAPASYAMARLKVRDREFHQALEHLAVGLDCAASANDFHTLRAAIFRHLGNREKAMNSAQHVLQFDPLDHRALYEAWLNADAEESKGAEDEFKRVMMDDPQKYLDLAFDLREAGLDDDARAVLALAPMGDFMVQLFQRTMGEPIAPDGKTDWVFPHRLQELVLLEGEVATHPTDGAAHACLGHLLYDKRRYREAIVHWKRAAELEPSNSVVLRNLGIAAFNFEHDPEAAKGYYQRARAANPSDGRLLFEENQLWKRLKVSPQVRLEELKKWPDLVQSRDDLALAYCALCHLTGDDATAAQMLKARHFAPWEGGEGVALGLFTAVQLGLADAALERGDASQAVTLLKEALQPPHYIGEARHLLANASDLWLALGKALQCAGEEQEATKWLRRAADFKGDFQGMAVRPFSEKTYFQAEALSLLGRKAESEALVDGLDRYAKDLQNTPAKIDYFATSLPTMLLFEDDLNLRQQALAKLLLAQVAYARCQNDAAESAFREVLAMDPDDIIATRSLKEMAYASPN